METIEIIATKNVNTVDDVLRYLSGESVDDDMDIYIKTMNKFSDINFSEYKKLETKALNTQLEVTNFNTETSHTFRMGAKIHILPLSSNEDIYSIICSNRSDNDRVAFVDDGSGETVCFVVSLDNCKIDQV